MRCRSNVFVLFAILLTTAIINGCGSGDGGPPDLVFSVRVEGGDTKIFLDKVDAMARNLDMKLKDISRPVSMLEGKSIIYRFYKSEAALLDVNNIFENDKGFKLSYYFRSTRKGLYECIFLEKSRLHLNDYLVFTPEYIEKLASCENLDAVGDGRLFH